MLRRQHFQQVVVATCLSAHATTGLYLLTAWMPAYYIQLTALPASVALALQTVNTAFLAVSIPLGGFLADKYGQATLLLATATATAAFGYPAWLLFEMSVPAVSWFCQFMLVVFVGLHWGGLPAALLQICPKGVSWQLAHVVYMYLPSCSSPQLRSFWIAYFSIALTMGKGN